MASHGCSLIRLDAFAYAVKKLIQNVTSSEPDLDLSHEVRDEAAKYQVELFRNYEHYSLNEDC